MEGNTSFNPKMDLAEFWGDIRGQDYLDPTHESVVLPRNVEDVNLENNNG